MRAALDVKEAKGQLAAQQPASRIPPMYPIGQMHGTYIFAQNENGLYIIDQHAAQERVKYEFFREKVGEVKKEVQEMLVPLTLEYATDEAIKIQENLEALKEVGVFLEPFGHNSFIVRSHPTWFPKNEEKEVIEEMIEHVLSIKKVDVKKLREKAAIMMSCRGSSRRTGICAMTKSRRCLMRSGWHPTRLHARTAARSSSTIRYTNSKKCSNVSCNSPITKPLVKQGVSFFLTDVLLQFGCIYCWTLFFRSASAKRITAFFVLAD